MALKVSILIPVYNASRWLRQCLDSIVGQTYQSLQVVLLDDGSADDSLSICYEYADRYPYVEVYHQENSGVAVARNGLLNKAQGDFVLFVDSDDCIVPDMVQVMVQLSEEYRSDVLVCDSYIMDEKGADVPMAVREERVVWDGARIIEEFLRHTTLRGQLWNKLVRRSLFEGKRFDSGVGYGEDAAMLWQVLSDVNKMVLTSRPLYGYRLLPSSISGQRFSYKKMSALNVWRKICADVEIRYPQYADIAKARYGAEVTLLLYNAFKTNPQDDNVAILRSTLSGLLPYMRCCDFISVKMFLFAWIAAKSSSLARLLV